MSNSPEKVYLQNNAKVHPIIRGEPLSLIRVPFVAEPYQIYPVVWIGHEPQISACLTLSWKLSMRWRPTLRWGRYSGESPTSKGKFPLQARGVSTYVVATRREYKDMERNLNLESETEIGGPSLEWNLPLSSGNYTNEANGTTDIDTRLENPLDVLSAELPNEVFIPLPTSRQDPQSPSSLVSIDDFNDLKDEDLVNLSVRELNKRIRGWPMCEVRKIRKRRRSLKNRGYANVCREKRRKEEHNIVQQREDMLAQLQRLRTELEQARKERDQYKAKNDELREMMGAWHRSTNLFSGRIPNGTSVISNSA